MLETLFKQEVTIATAVGGVIFALTQNIPFFLLSVFVTWWSIGKFNEISLKKVENKEKEKVANEWNKLLEECLEYSSAGQVQGGRDQVQLLYPRLNSVEVMEKGQLLALMQRDRVTSVEIDERVGKSLETHIEFSEFTFRIRLKERRLAVMHQRVSHIERVAEEFGHKSLKVENNEEVIITLSPKEKMRKLNVAEREEE